MILSDYQAMYGSLLMGPGTPYDIDWSKCPALDLPSIRASDTERARGDGAWEGEEYASAQTIPFSIQVFDWVGIPIATAVQALLNETTPRVPRDMWFKLPYLDSPRMLRGVRVRRRAVPLVHVDERYARAELDLYAADPARYGTLSTLTALAGTSNKVAGVNEGDLDSWPVFHLTHPTGIGGPVTLTHEQSGSVIGISTTTLPGQVLVIDPSVGTAIVDGVIDRGADLTSRQWWAIGPRAPFTVALSAPAGTRLDVVWRPSWW